jgi:molybdate transport system substrate-binding protein
MHLKVLHLTPISLLILMAGCGLFTPPSASQVQSSEGGSGSLMVFAAASLTGAFNQIGASFEAGRAGTKVTFNFAGSQQLAQQLAQGAPADVFASADEGQMDAAIQAGRIGPTQKQVFISNHLVVIFPRENPAGIARLEDLSKPGLNLVLAAGAVPVGAYSLEFLDRASRQPEFGPDFKDKVIANVVSYEENVKAVLSKVQLGEADAGIVYVSDVAQAGSSQIGQLEIPALLNPTASYFIAPVEDSPNLGVAEAFIDFALSSAGQETLAKFGFIPVR